MNVEEIDLDAWEAALPRSGFEVFHTPAALSVLGAHTTGTLRLFCGYNGDNPVGLFPLVEQTNALGTALVSPVPSMGFHRLGPLVMPASPKQRKREKLNRSFVSQVLERVGAADSRTLLRVICPLSYADPRPFDWEGFDVTTAFTYTLDTGDATLDDLLAEASSSLRRELRNARESDVSIAIEGSAAARQIYEQTSERYAEQDQEFSLDWEFVQDLTTALADRDRCRVYVARTPTGEFLSGVTVLYSNDTAYFWQGGARATHEGAAVNSLLHWSILEDIIEDPPRETVTRYDLMGGNTERLSRYKSKFGADLVPYYVTESNGTQMALAKRAYRLLAGRA